jgi:hypothetical protein
MASLYKFIEIRLIDIASADAVGGYARLLGEDAGGELFRRHLK